ncbi:xanthine dehydrogenase accessory protein XdhC [uncultured Sphingomonas sp.]|uniref:xanthine dehydrogenase accessory protein XdhC n=1 Tax=uncultured Sphingomonas sp. TaxID=158754 RepID=UPI0035C95A7E
MIDWLDHLRALPREEAAALIGVLATEGSAPRGAGTRMLVTAAAMHGTIGGGQLEHRAVEQARQLLDHPPGSWRVQDYPLGPLLGQCCGGRVRLLIEHIDPGRLGWLAGVADTRVLLTTLTDGGIDRAIGDDVSAAVVSARGDRPRAGAIFAEVIGRYRRPLWLFGAGHVGKAIARHATYLPFRLAWFDTRAAFEAIEGVTVVPDDMIAECIAEAPEDTAIVVLTHDHALDYVLTRAALERGRCAYVGLIGSATKRMRFQSRLEKDGVDAAARAQLVSPIGIAGVDGDEPDVIAVALLAQLLQLGPA